MIASEDALEREHLQCVAAVAGVDVKHFDLPSSHDVVLRKLRFHYLDWSSEGPPIVFLHGGNLNAHTFDVVCLALHDDFQCLSLDQRGHGDSEWPPDADYRIEAQIEDIEAFRARLGLERFVLVGMSMGGMNAMGYAAAHADRLAALVLIDVGPDVRAEGVAAILQFVDETPEMESVDAFVDRSLSFNPRRDRDLLRRSLLRNLRQLPNGRWTWKWDARRRTAVDPAEKLRRRALLWDGVDRITCPTLIVRGGESRVFLAEDAETLCARLPDARIATVPRAGHSVQGDNAAGLLIELRSFLADLGYGA